MNQFGLVLTEDRRASRSTRCSSGGSWTRSAPTRSSGSGASANGGRRKLKVNSGSGNGGGHVQISAREMARFGHLFLNGGNWNGKQLISAEWVEQATAVQVPADAARRLPDEQDRGLGLLRLQLVGQRRQAGRPAQVAGRAETTFAALGHNNNLCSSSPKWQMVIVRLGLDQADRKIGDDVTSASSSSGSARRLRGEKKSGLQFAAQGAAFFRPLSRPGSAHPRGMAMFRCAPGMLVLAFWASNASAVEPVAVKGSTAKYPPAMSVGAGARSPSS